MGWHNSHLVCFLQTTWPPGNRGRATYFARVGKLGASFVSSAAANLPSPSRICARDQAAKPNVRAGSGFAFIKHEDNGDGLMPTSAQTRVMTGKSSFRRSHATKC